MSFQAGSAVDYKDLLTQLREILTSEHIATAAPSAGGTGYTVGDELTATGGTFSHAASFVVTTVGGSGEVTGLRLRNCGAYTSNPSSPVSTTGGTGTGCTVTVTFGEAGWIVQRESQQALSATVAAGGTGYSVGNDLTLVGGFGVGTAAVFNVDTVGGSGEVLTVSLVTAGAYEDPPVDPVATTGGAGTGATLNVTFEPAVDTERTLILEGGAITGYVGAKPTVGIRTFQTAAFNSPSDTAFNWGALGMASFNPLLEWFEQPGISPGFDTDDGDPSLQAAGAFVLLKDDDGFPMDFWLSHDERRFALAAKLENGVVTHYSTMYLGFLNPFGTQAEFPYPMFVAGSSSRFNAWYTTTTMRYSGIVELVGIQNIEGPAFYRRQDLTWPEVRNSILVDVASPTRSAGSTVVAFPCGQPSAAPVAVADQTINVQSQLLFAGGGGSSVGIIPQAGVPGVATYQLWPTPDSGGDIRLPVPVTIISSEDVANFEIIGELEGVVWVSGANGVSPEDTFTTTDGEVYRVFKNGNRAEVYSLLAIRES